MQRQLEKHLFEILFLQTVVWVGASGKVGEYKWVRPVVVGFDIAVGASGKVGKYKWVRPVVVGFDIAVGYGCR
jgi:hypothetical protein